MNTQSPKISIETIGIYPNNSRYTRIYNIVIVIRVDYGIIVNIYEHKYTSVGTESRKLVDNDYDKIIEDISELDNIPIRDGYIVLNNEIKKRLIEDIKRIKKIHKVTKD